MSDIFDSLSATKGMEQAPTGDDKGHAPPFDTDSDSENKNKRVAEIMAMAGNLKTLPLDEQRSLLKFVVKNKGMKFARNLINQIMEKPDAEKFKPKSPTEKDATKSLIDSLADEKEQDNKAKGQHSDKDKPGMTLSVPIIGGTAISIQEPLWLQIHNQRTAANIETIVPQAGEPPITEQVPAAVGQNIGDQLEAIALLQQANPDKKPNFTQALELALNAYGGMGKPYPVDGFYRIATADSKNGDAQIGRLFLVESQTGQVIKVQDNYQWPDVEKSGGGGSEAQEKVADPNGQTENNNNTNNSDSSTEAADKE